MFQITRYLLQEQNSITGEVAHEHPGRDFNEQPLNAFTGWEQFRRELAQHPNRYAPGSGLRLVLKAAAR